MALAHRAVLALLAAALVAGAARASDPPLNLAEHARITATGVRDQQNPGWIMDEQDGPAAARDGDPTTGWAPLAVGEQRLMLDFAFINPAPFELRRVVLRWSPPPDQPPRVLFGEAPDALTEVAPDPTDASRFVPEDRLEGRALVVTVNNPGPESRLVEIVVHGAGSDEPEEPQVNAETAGNGSLVLSWPALARSRVHHVEIHRSRDAGFTPSPASRLVEAHGESVTIPPPRAHVPIGLELAVTAVGHDGTSVTARQRFSQVARAAGEPAFRVRGVIEGFYGRPWPHRQRLAMIRTLGDRGFNFYASAPKDDPPHRAAWRELLSMQALDRCTELLAAGVRHGVRVAFTLSPGLSLDPESDEDFQALMAKLTPLIDVGYRDFGLLLDDIPVRPDAEIGASHARFATRLKSHLAARAGQPVFLFFVPTVYSGVPDGLDEAPRAYLEALASLPDDVPVAWTGPRVFSREVPAEQARALRRLMGSQPLILWDNYPVNDAGARRDLFLGAILDRGADLAEVLDGVLINPMVQGAASRIPVRAYSDLLHHPGEYDARASFDRACALELAGSELPCLAHLVEYFTGSDRMSTHAADASSLRAAVDAFQAAAEQPRTGSFGEASLSLATALARAWRTETCLAAGLTDLDLADDLTPAARAVAVVGRDGMEALRLAQRRAHGDEAIELAQRVRAARLAQRRGLWQVGGGVGRQLLEAVLAGPLHPATNDGPALHRLVARPPVTARVGERYAFDVRLEPPAEAARFHLVGPEGMQVDGAGRVSWNPRISGRRRFVVIAAAPTGLDLLPIEVQVTSAEYGSVVAARRAGRVMVGVLLGALVLAMLLAAAAHRRARGSSADA